MPSDDSGEMVRAVVEALQPQADRFRSAITTTCEQLDTLLASQRVGAGARVEQTTRELGAFATAHFDFERLAALSAPSEMLSTPVCDRIAEALRALRAVTETLNHAPVAIVPPGGNVRSVTASSLAVVGRAFGAALSVQLAKKGRLSSQEHAGLLDGFPFSRWNKSERLVGPPLVISTDGADLHAGALAEFLDGRQKLVIVVRGNCAPAPLVRLITPGTFVMQTNSLSDISKLTSCDGAGIAAVVPESAARFVHDPAAGLTVDFMPPKPPTRALGGLSAQQQNEELRQLATLVMSSATAAAGTVAGWAKDLGAAPSGDPVDVLAGWLLRQAHFDVKA